MASFDIDGDLVRKLADLLRETGLSEIEFAEGEKRIRVTRPTASQTVAVQAAPVLAAAPAASWLATSDRSVLGRSSGTSPLTTTTVPSAGP